MMDTRSGSWVLGRCLLVVAMAGMARPAAARLGQPDSLPAPPPAEPAVPGPVERPRSIVPSLPVSTPGGRQLTVEAVRPGLSGTPMAELGYTSNPYLVREGAFVANARARIVRGKTGHRFAIFDTDSAGRTLPPMVLLESANLASMERLLEHAADGTRVRLNGQATVYHDRNFLLLTAPPLMERAAEAAPIAPEIPAAPQGKDIPAGAPAPTTGPTATPAEPSIAQIIADLDKAVGAKRDSAPTRDRSSNARTADTGEPDPTAADNQFGGYLTSRRGRLVRSSDGTLAFRLDSGSVGRTEPAYTLLPCQNLGSLDGWFDANGDATAMVMSGEVTVYRGRAFLLPQMYSVPRATDVVLPTQ